MADLDQTEKRQKPGLPVKRRKKLSTRVDLTPMVDLGFLLITFFIFVSAISLPRAMRLFLPKDSPIRDFHQVSNSGVLTILLGKNNQLYYYERDDPGRAERADYKSIRDIILRKKRSTDPGRFEIILKPSPEASYKNTVDALDEMTIDAVKHYTLVDITPFEYQLIRDRKD